MFVLATLITLPIQSIALRMKGSAKTTIPLVYHRFVCWAIGIRVHVVGKPVTESGVLIASNHTSWLDIPVLSSVRGLSFVAKSEVETWPFFGMLAGLQRSIFVERKKRAKTAEQRDQLQARLSAGDAIVLFPEGTSSDGNRVLPFNSALLSAGQLKIDTATQKDIDVPVQPVSVAYTHLQGLPMGREFRPFFAWYGDMELLPHLWDAFLLGPIDVVVEFHPPLTITQCGSRKVLAAQAERMIARGLARALAGAQDVAPVLPKPQAVEVEESEAALV